MQVTAVAYDNNFTGFHTNNTINLRLWAAKPDREFDLEAFNTGDYVQVCFSLSSMHGHCEWVVQCTDRLPSALQLLHVGLSQSQDPHPTGQ